LLYESVFVLHSSDPDALSQFFDPNSCPITTDLDDTVCIAQTWFLISVNDKNDGIALRVWIVS